MSAQHLTKDQLNALTLEKLPKAAFSLKEFLQLPNNGHFPEQAKNNLLWCDSIFKTLEFKTTIIKTGGIPLLFAEKKSIKRPKPYCFTYKLMVSPWIVPNGTSLALIFQF